MTNEKNPEIHDNDVLGKVTSALRTYDENANKALKVMRETHADELKQHDILNQEKISKINDAMADMREEFTRQLADAKEREAQLRRPEAGNNGAKDLSQKYKHMADTIRANLKPATLAGSQPDGQHTLNTTNGSVLLDPDFYPHIEDLLKDQNPIRKFAKIRNTASSKLQYPVQTKAIESGVVAEGTARTQSGTNDPTFVQIEIDAHLIHAEVDVTYEQAADNDVGLVNWLYEEIAEQIGSQEMFYNIKGTGTGQPRGLLGTDDTNATIPSRTGTGGQVDLRTATGGGLTYELLIRARQDLRQQYRQKATWMMNREVMGDVMLLQDTSGGTGTSGGGSYIYMPDYVPGMGEFGMLLGRPVVECDSMDDFSTAANVPIIFGDLSKFVIWDRQDINFLFDPYTRASNGSVRIRAWSREGSSIIRNEAFRKIVKR